MQKTAPIRGRSLRENSGMAPPAQQLGDFLIDYAGMPTAAAAQENGLVLRGQPADDRPAPDLFLGNEGHRHGRIDDQDVDPRNVIGDHQRARRQVGQIGLDLDTQRPQQGRRPAPPQTQARQVRAEGKKQQGGQRTTQNQRRQKRYPPGADQEIGFSQSACPK